MLALPLPSYASRRLARSGLEKIGRVGVVSGPRYDEVGGKTMDIAKSIDDYDDFVFTL